MSAAPALSTASLDDNVMEVFSEEVKRRKIIWQPSHIYHKKHNLVQSAWQEVMSALEASFTEDELVTCEMDSVAKLKTKLRTKRDTRQKQKKRMVEKDEFGIRKPHRVKLDGRFSFLDTVQPVPRAPRQYVGGGAGGDVDMNDAGYSGGNQVENGRGVMQAAPAMHVEEEDRLYTSSGRYHDDEEEEEDPTWALDRQDGSYSPSDSLIDQRTQAVASVCQAIADSQKQDDIDHLFEYFKSKFRRFDRRVQNELTDKFMTMIRQCEEAGQAAAAAAAEAAAAAAGPSNAVPAADNQGAGTSAS